MFEDNVHPIGTQKGTTAASSIVSSPLSWLAIMSEIEIRPFCPTDLAGVLHLLADAMPADPISETRFTRQVLLDINFRAEGAPVATLGGKIVGFALAIARQAPLENAPNDADRG